MRVRHLWVAISVLEACASPSEPVASPPNTRIGLHVWAEVTPPRVRASDSAAVLTIRVLAENPSDSTLRIVSGGPPYTFTPDPAESRGLEQSFRIASARSALNAGPSVDYWGDIEYVFGPHERSVVTYKVPLKVWRDGNWPLTPGQYRVRGYFNGQEGASASFAIVP